MLQQAQRTAAGVDQVRSLSIAPKHSLIQGDRRVRIVELVLVATRGFHQQLVAGGRLLAAVGGLDQGFGKAHVVTRALG